MKYDYERIALWSIVVALVIAVFFQQRRSGFSLKTNADTSTISMLDMMEYKYIPEEKRTMYKNMLTSNAATLSSTTDGMTYKMRVEQMMMTALNMQPNPVPGPRPIPNPGPTPMPNTGPTPMPNTGPMNCTGVIVAGDCLNSGTCPLGMMTRSIGSLRYCVCSTPGQKIIPPSGPGIQPRCEPSCPPTMPKLITEKETGQQTCAFSCPISKPGYTCQ